MANKILRKRPNRLLSGRNNYFFNAGPLNNAFGNAFPAIDSSMGGVGNPTNAANSLTGAVNPYYTPAKIKGGSNINLGNVDWGGVAGVGASLIGNIVGMSNKIASSDIANSYNTFENSLQGPDAVENATIDQAVQDWKSYRKTTAPTAEQFGKLSGGEIASDVLSQGLSTGLAGFAVNPIVGAVGAGIGALTSLIGSAARNRKANIARDKSAIAAQNIDAYRRNSLLNEAYNAINNVNYDAVANYAAYGGQFNSQHGGYFTNGLQFINNGGTHEDNPYEGVPVGVDPEGTPNLVEEGEVIFNDYVFSNRLKVPRGMRGKYKYGGKKGVTFADFAEFLGKESEERPNDPISKNGLNALMGDLANAQEQLKAQQGMNNETMGIQALYGANGGYLANRYDDGGSKKRTLRKNNGVMNGNDPLYQYFSEYLGDNGAIDFKKLYAADSPWSIARNKVLELFRSGDSEKIKEFQKWYAEGLNEYNRYNDDGSLRKDWKDFTPDEITEKLFSGYSSDYDLGFGHRVMGMDEISRFIDPPERVRMYRPGNGEKATDLPEEFAYFEGPDASGFDWKHKIDGKLTFGNSYYDKENNRIIDYYDPMAGAKKEPDKHRFLDLEGNLVEEGLADDFINKGWDYTKYDKGRQTSDGTWVYRMLEDKPYQPYNPSFVDQGWLGLGVDALKLGLATGFVPNYADEEAFLNAAANARDNYPTINADPLGDYTRKKYTDIDYLANKAKQTGLSGIRTAVNNSAGNRGAANAAVLAGMNSLLANQGDLYHQAYLDNRAEDTRAETFNRETNMANIQNRLTAAKANQDAALKGIDWYLNSAWNAANSKYTKKNNWMTDIGMGLDALSTTAHNMARQRQQVGMYNNLMSHDIAPGYSDDFNYYMGARGARKRGQANGGSIKRRKKGLTY